MSAFIRRLLAAEAASRPRRSAGLEPAGASWGRLVHLLVMDTQRTSALGLEPLLTTGELADYLGVRAQAIYDLRADGRGPVGIRVGRKLRYRSSDVRHWLDALQVPGQAPASAGER